MWHGHAFSRGPLSGFGLTGGLCAPQGEKGKRGVDGMDGMKVSPPGCWGPGEGQWAKPGPPDVADGASRGPSQATRESGEVLVAPKPPGQARSISRVGLSWAGMGEPHLPSFPGGDGVPRLARLQRLTRIRCKLPSVTHMLRL